MFNPKQSLVCVLMLLALLLQGQVQAAGLRCGLVQGGKASAALASQTARHPAHPDAHSVPMAHHGHHAEEEASDTALPADTQGGTAAQAHGQVSGHVDCTHLAACCHGAAMPAPLVALAFTPSSLMLMPQPAQRPAQALIARLERPPITPLS